MRLCTVAQFTTKPISKKKLRHMNKGKGLNDYSRFHRKKEEHAMAVEDTEKALSCTPVFCPLFGSLLRPKSCCVVLCTND